MARVVQRRKTFPYALIVFVALFLIAMVGVVVLYNKVGQLQTQLAPYDQKLSRIVSRQEEDSDRYKQLLQVAIESNARQTVYSQLNSKLAELTQRIVGYDTTPEDAIRRTDALYTEIQSSHGLIAEVRAARGDRRDANSQKQDAEKERNTFRSEAEKLREELTARDQAHAATRQELQQKVLGTQKQLGDITQLKDQQIEALRKDAQQVQQEKEKLIQQGTQKVQEVNEQKHDLQRQVEELTVKASKKLRRIEAAMQADGVVIGLEQENTIAYVNLGSRDGMEVGFSLAVFPKSGIPKASEKPEEKQKASLIIIGVGEDVSRCQVTMLKSQDNPILEGDPTINVAFDSVRRWRFVVEGHFDLHGGNSPTEMGAAEVTLLLRRLGAEVTNELDYDVDFLVLGAEPAPPRRPDDEAPPQTWETFRQAVKIRQQWTVIRNKAIELGIPIMNTNTLLALTGYTPIKALREVPQ